MPKDTQENTLPIAGEGKVAQLEWRYSEHTSNWYADTPFSQYIAWEISRNAYYLPVISKTPVRAGTTIDEAKAAAQTDYQTRILSALISSPGKDGGQEVVVAYAPRGFTGEGYVYASANDAGRDPIPLYTRPQPASTALVERLEIAEAALTQIANAFTAHTYSDAMDAVQLSRISRRRLSMPSVEERLRYWRTRAQRMQVALEDISTDTVQGPLDDELGLIMRMQDLAKEVLGDDPSEFDQLRAKIERLTKALEPFANAADRYTNLVLGEDIDHWPCNAGDVTLGHLRAARDTLASEKGGR